MRKNKKPGLFLSILLSLVITLNTSAFASDRIDNQQTQILPATAVQTESVDSFEKLEDVPADLKSELSRSPELRHSLRSNQRGYTKRFEANVDMPGNRSGAQKPLTEKLNPERLPRAAASAVNNNPNGAVYLPSSYYGIDLYDLADAEDRWYYMSVTDNQKISVNFFQEANGDYDVLLYQLIGSSLYLVDFSETSGTQESINFIAATGGDYYIRVAPYAPTSVPYMFMFYVNATSSYDPGEPNDSPEKATVKTNTMNVSANIDSQFDEDWYKLTVTSQKEKNITAGFPLSTSAYAVYLYDSSYNTVGSFMADGGTRKNTFNVGVYYVRVMSLTGDYSPTNYSVKVVDYVPPAPQPIDGFTLPPVILPDGTITLINQPIEYQSGGYIEYDINFQPGEIYPGSDSFFYTDNRYSLIELRWEIWKSSSVAPMWTSWVDTIYKPGSHHGIINIPLRDIYQFGSPMYEGEVRLSVAVGGAGDDVEFSGTFKSYGR